MPIPDTDKPPICMPAPVVVHRAMQPSGHVPDSREIMDAAPLPARHSAAPVLVLHWTFLGMAVGVVVASLLLEIRSHEHVVLPFVNVTLPGTCTFRESTGMPCPGCGLTRAFISVAHGEIRDAWRYNPAGFLFFAIVVFQIPYRVYQIARIRRGLGQHCFKWIDAGGLTLLIISLICQWVFRLIAGPL